MILPLLLFFPVCSVITTYCFYSQQKTLFQERKTMNSLKGRTAIKEILLELF